MASKAALPNPALFAVIALLVVFTVITILNQNNITSFAAAEKWENFTQITADNSQEFITAHIVFGQYKPANCADGIDVDVSSQFIAFRTENETYDNSGFCLETDVIFNNTIYNSFDVANITYILYWGAVGFGAEAENIAEQKSGQMSLAEIQPEVMQALETNETVPVTIVIENKKPADIAETKTSVADALIDSDVQYFPEAKAYAADVTAEQVEHLASIRGIAVEAQQIFQLDLSVSVPYINTTKVWPILVNGDNITGKGITVCIIDTGANYSHPALGGCFGAGCKVLGGYDYANNDSDPMDDNGHGTHVAGIVASNDSTYRGVAPGANLVVVKSFSAGGGATSQDIANGIKWCKDNKDAFNISVISMSFGNGGTYSAANCPPDSLIDPEIIAANNASLLLIASAGNSYISPGVSYPACKPYVVAIGATGRNDSNVQGFSKSGDALDLLAPGASIVSTSKDGSTFITLSGTSMAAPHVSGLAAIVLQYNKLKNSITLSADAVENKLKLTGINVTDSRTGVSAPLVNAFAAISPIISLESPLNKTYASGNLNFNITVDSNISSATVEINGTIYNLTNDSTAHWYNLTIPEAANGTNNATFFVFSDANSSKTVFFTIDNTAPAITLESPANESNISRGDILNFTVTSRSDVDTVWTEFNGINSTLDSPYDYDTSNWTKGLQNITVYANTTAGSINSSFFMFDVNNSAPVFASGQPSSTYIVLVTRPITIIANATDSDNDSVSYTISTNITSSWTNTTSDGIVNWSWTPTSAEAGSYYLRFSASDGIRSTVMNSTITVRANSAPSLSSIASQTATAGSQKIIDFIASDADLSYGDGLSWSDNTAIFNVAKVDATTARATFTPTSSQSGTSSVTITVTDIVGASSSRIFTLTINNATSTAAAGNDEDNELPVESLYDNEKTFGSIPQGTPASFSPSVAGLSVDNIIVETNSDVNDIVTLKIRRLGSAAISAPGNVINYFELVAEGLPAGKIKNVKIQFSIAKTWLAQTGFSKEDVHLSTLSGSTWTELPTATINEDEVIVTYEAITTHLSDFAIAANKAAEIIPPTTTYRVTNTTTPTAMFAANTGSTITFLIVVAVITLAIALYTFSKKPKSPARPKQVVHKKTKAATTREVPDFGFH